MTDNTTDELERTIRDLLKKPQGMFEGYRLIHDDTVKDFIALISNREKLARIDELENGMLINTNSPSILTGYIHNRLDTLRKELDGGQE